MFPYAQADEAPITPMYYPKYRGDDTLVAYVTPCCQESAKFLENLQAIDDTL
jgi:hypothetical protein